MRARAVLAGVTAALALTGAGLVSAAAAAAAPPSRVSTAGTTGTTTAASAGSAATAQVPRFTHIVVTFMENEDATSTFEDPAAAPNLAALRKLGSYVPNYYGVGHNSLDNYLALFSGEKPTSNTEADCMGHPVGTCTYPATVPTLATTLTAAKDTWKIYSEGMDGVPVLGGNCLHQTDPDGIDEFQGPGSNGYATRHNPAMWFDSIIDNAGSCAAHSVDYTQLARDDRSGSTLPTFSFVEPDTCHDGHDDSELEGYCALDPEGASAPYGVRALDDWLGNGAAGGTGFVSTLLDSPAWKTGNNLLVITFDEAIATGTGSDTTGCTACHDGSAGGRIGALLIGTGVKQGYVSSYVGDHYGLLRTIEASEGLPTLTSKATSTDAAATVLDGSATPITDVFQTTASTATAAGGTAAAGPAASTGSAASTGTRRSTAGAPDTARTAATARAAASGHAGTLAFTGLRAAVPLTALVLVGAGGATAALRRRH